MAVLAHPPEPATPAYFHVSSRRPQPADLRRSSTTACAPTSTSTRSTAGDRGAARLPDWRFPGARGGRAAAARTSERAHKVADYVVGHAPRSDRTRDLARKLDQQGRRLEFLRRYLDLYREYAQAELRFSDDNTLALLPSLDAEDRETFAFDTAVIDWHALPPARCTARRSPTPIRRLDELRRAAQEAGRAAGVLKQVEPAAAAGSRRSSTWTARCCPPT